MFWSEKHLWKRLIDTTLERQAAKRCHSMHEADWHRLAAPTDQSKNTKENKKKKERASLREENVKRPKRRVGRGLPKRTIFFVSFFFLFFFFLFVFSL
jgi:hypothetical protein